MEFNTTHGMRPKEVSARFDLVARLLKFQEISMKPDDDKTDEEKAWLEDDPLSLKDRVALDELEWIDMGDADIIGEDERVVAAQRNLAAYRKSSREADYMVMSKLTEWHVLLSRAVEVVPVRHDDAA